VTKSIRTGLIVVFGLIWLAPVYLMVVNASKPATEYDSRTVWKPDGFSLFSNINDAWQKADLSHSVLSTLLYSTVSPLVAVIVCAAAGYAIVALRLKHGFLWFAALFAGTIFPLQMLLVPLFVGYADSNLYDTRMGMLLVYTAISVPFATFVMRNYFSGISFSLYEAATVDGASSWRIFWRIYLPLASSALGAIFILQAVFVWNDLLLGLTLSQADNVRPIMPALTSLQSAYGGSALPTVLAGAVLVSLPTIALFLGTQRLFARGMALGQF
jgi:multiple sugar transport system permease protein